MKNSSYIKVPAMLEAMKATNASGRPRPFRIGYLTADRARRSGGRYRTIEKATLSQRRGRSGSVRGRLLTIEAPGLATPISVHLDAILYFNDQPVS